MECKFDLVWRFYQFLGSISLLFPQEYKLPFIEKLMDWCADTLDKKEEL